MSDTTVNKKKTLPTFSCLLIPIHNNKTKGDTLLSIHNLIPTCSNLYLSFLIPENLTDYTTTGINDSIRVKCKVFNKLRSGFTTIYIVKTTLLYLFRNNFALSREQFDQLEKLFVYQFLSFRGEKTTWNNGLILKSSAVYARLAQMYSTCCSNAYVWYRLLTTLIRTDKYLPNNIQLYAEQYDEVFPTTIRNYPKMDADAVDDDDDDETIMSINSKNLWCMWFTSKIGANDVVMTFTREFHDHLEQLYHKGINIFKKFNDATKDAVGGLNSNMLFFEMVAKHFSSQCDIISEDENYTNQTLIPEFKKTLQFLNGAFFDELKSYCNKTKNVEDADFDTLQSYRSLAVTEVRGKKRKRETVPVHSTALVAGKINEQAIQVHELVFKDENITRTWLNKSWTKTGLYPERKYFTSNKKVNQELAPHLPFPLYTPYVHTTLVSQPNRYVYTHISNIQAFDAPFENKLLYKIMAAFIHCPCDGHFIQYTTSMYKIIQQNDYAYNEQIIQNFPIYALSFDIDITDKFVITRYYSKNNPTSNLVDNKFEMRQHLVDVMIKTFKVIGIDDFNESNSEFIMFESLPEPNKQQTKLGLRLIIRSQKYFVKDAGVMLNIIKIANFLINFNNFLPTGCIDEAIYQQVGHYMRLPMNSKRNTVGTLIRPLIPILTKKIRCGVPSVGLIHHLHSTLDKLNCKMITNAPNIIDCPTTQSVLPANITKRMITNKMNCAKGSNVIYTHDFTDAINEKITPLIAKIILDQTKQSVSLNAVRKGFSNIYILATKLFGVCVKRNHIVPEGNPCEIKCVVKNNENDEDSVNVTSWQFCYGADCKSTCLHKDVLMTK